MNCGPASMNQWPSIPDGTNRGYGRAPSVGIPLASPGNGKQHYHSYMAKTLGGNMQDSPTKMEMQPNGTGVLILTCHGDLSWEDRDQLSKCVERHFDGAAEVDGVIMDLSGVEHVNSAGLGALFQLTRLLRGKGGVLMLANASAMLVRVFRTIGLDRLAQVSESVESAAGILAARGNPDEIRLLPETDVDGAAATTNGRSAPDEHRQGS